MGALLVLDRVLELQESPCLHGSGIVIAVEGPSSASLLAKHGPLPDRSYICLVRPRRSRGGSANERGGTFDEGYYWHGVGETPAVEEVRFRLRGIARVLLVALRWFRHLPPAPPCGVEQRFGELLSGPLFFFFFNQRNDCCMELNRSLMKQYASHGVTREVFRR